MESTITLPASNILDFIPQRHPIVMVGRLLESNEENKSATTEFDVESNNIFFRDDTFSISGIIEHMAQSCALKSGFEASLAVKEHKPPVGYIGAVKNFILSRLPIVSEVLCSTLEVVTQIQQVSVVEVVTKSGEDLIATAQLHIYQMEA